MPPIILVGEANPYGADPKYALYPLPERASGDRLCTLIMGLDRAEYLRRFERVNLCPSAWSIKQARVNAEALRVRAKAEDAILVLLGSKVHTAFDWAFNPFTVTYLDPKGHYVSLPHPSGLSRAWNEPGAVAIMDTTANGQSAHEFLMLAANPQWAETFKDLNNLSNCMCELDKYCRVLKGEGKPRARYKATCA